MKKIIPLKTYLWKADWPTFQEGKEYELNDDLANEMVKYGYAKYIDEDKCKIKKMQNEETKEDKMMHIDIIDNKRNVKRKARNWKK